MALPDSGQGRRAAGADYLESEESGLELAVVLEDVEAGLEVDRVDDPLG
jgi:hypothetical protein